MKCYSYYFHYGVILNENRIAETVLISVLIFENVALIERRHTTDSLPRNSPSSLQKTENLGRFLQSILIYHIEFDCISGGDFSIAKANNWVSLIFVTICAWQTRVAISFNVHHHQCITAEQGNGYTYLMAFSAKVTAKDDQNYSIQVTFLPFSQTIRRFENNSY